MTVTETINLDFQRQSRIGLEEAILCSGKSLSQLCEILIRCQEVRTSVLLTRLSEKLYRRLPAPLRAQVDYDLTSNTAIFGAARALKKKARIAIVSAGSSDWVIAREVERTLNYFGEPAALFIDIGVAGIWRLHERLADICSYQVVVVVAGMDAALVSVLGGLVGASIIAVPTSTGYGVANEGRTALAAILTSCAPGVVVVNIDNGYGAACAAFRIIRSIENLARFSEE